MAAQSKLDVLPPELVFSILSYLVRPSSRLPGLTETQSEHDYPPEKKRKARQAYHLHPTRPPDYSNPPYRVVQLIQATGYPHPFNALAASSRVLRDLVEMYCAHLVVKNNRFNLPVLQAQENGPQSVYPDMSGIVYRRLWLQYAPRHCYFCKRLMHEYPHKRTEHPVQACLDCANVHILIINEVEEQLHISRFELDAYRVHGGKEWVLRTDVDALALQFYGTKAFHDQRGERQQCGICVKAGTLGRIMRVREHRQARIWQPIKGTAGWVVKKRDEDDEMQLGEQEMGVDEQGEFECMEEEDDAKKVTWRRYYSYVKNLYMYQDDEFDAGYNLQSYVP